MLHKHIHVLYIETKTCKNQILISYRLVICHLEPKRPCWLWYYFSIFLKKFQKSISMFYNFYRLSPPYYIAVAFFTHVFPSITSNMPIYMIDGIDAVNSPLIYCHENWWTNLLFINNMKRSEAIDPRAKSRKIIRLFMCL